MHTSLLFRSRNHTPRREVVESLIVTEPSRLPLSLEPPHPLLLVIHTDDLAPSALASTVTPGVVALVPAALRTRRGGCRRAREAGHPLRLPEQSLPVASCALCGVWVYRRARTRGCPHRGLRPASTAVLRVARLGARPSTPDLEATGRARLRVLARRIHWRGRFV